MIDKTMNVLGDLFFCTFMFLLGVIVAGQFLMPSAAFWFGFVAVGITFTKTDRWGPIDMLLLRRLFVIVGLTTLIAIQVTGVIATSGLVNVSTTMILMAGMYSPPVYIAMAAAFIVTVGVHYWLLRKKK